MDGLGDVNFGVPVEQTSAPSLASFMTRLESTEDVFIEGAGTSGASSVCEETVHPCR
jgi:hypothetical protein